MSHPVIIPDGESFLAASDAASYLRDLFEDFGEVLDYCDTIPREEATTLLCGWFRHDVGAFGLALFPDRIRSSYNRLHLDLFSETKYAHFERTEARNEACASPRGSAKSTIVSFLDLIHDAVYGIEAFVGLATNISQLSEAMVADLYGVLSDPDQAPALHELYGPFEVAGTKTDFAVKSPYGRRAGTCFRAFSMRSTVRGHKYASYRFTKFIIDDGEHPERVKRAQNRDADEQHIDSDIAKAGEPGMWLRMFGTVLISDSVLQRKLTPEQSLKWEGKKYKAIMSWPDEREGKWEEGRDIWTDLTVGSSRARMDRLREWYEENQEVLDAGSEVLWHARRPLLDLMVSYWSEPLSFWAEDQNEPRLSTQLVFEVDKLRYVSFDGNRIIRDDGSSVMLDQCAVRIFWDPKPEGRKDTGRDSAGWAVVAKCPAGAYYVLHTYQIRADKRTQWLVTANIMGRFPTAFAGYENNRGSLDEDPGWVRFCRDNGMTGRIRGFQSHGSKKDDRIADLQPDTLNGFLRFARSDIDPETYAQLRHWPSGRNDDIIDAIERARWLHTVNHISTVEAYK